MSDKYGNPDPIGDVFRNLYGSDAVDAFFNRANFFMSGMPIVGGLFTAAGNYRYYSDYMSNRNISWSHVKYPTRLSSGNFGSAVNFVSRNIDKLYR